MEAHQPILLAHTSGLTALVINGGRDARDEVRVDSGAPRIRVL